MIQSIQWIARGAAAAAVCAALLGCPPSVAPMWGGAPAAPLALRYELPPGHRRVTFTWELEEGSMVVRGEGAARIAAPDSARVDLFITGGYGAASVILIGDSLRVPPGAGMQQMIPPKALLWAALGRLAIPALPDTIIRVLGDTTWSEIGHPLRWRLVAIRGELTRLERISGRRVVEWVDRVPGQRIRYEVFAQRSLVLKIQHDQPVAPFDASVWQY